MFKLFGRYEATNKLPELVNVATLEPLTKIDKWWLDNVPNILLESPPEKVFPPIAHALSA